MERRTFKRAGNIVQIGFQRRQSSAFRHAGQYIREGKAGNIRQIVAQIHYRANPGDNTIQDPPASLDWDEWCGPADLATVFVSDSRFVVMPAERDAERTEINLPTEGGMQERHMADFLDAVRLKDHGKISCTVEDAFSTGTAGISDRRVGT